MLDIVYAHCAALDIRKKKVEVCVRECAADGHKRHALRSFRNKIPDLLEMRDWLKSEHPPFLALEAKNPYWQAVYALLEDVFTLQIVDARLFMNVPAHLPDISNAEWLAELFSFGLFVPCYDASPPPSRRMRKLLAQREDLLLEREMAEQALQQAVAEIPASPDALDIATLATPTHPSLALYSKRIERCDAALLRLNDEFAQCLDYLNALYAWD